MEMEQANKTTAAVTVTDDYAVIVSDKEGLQSFFKDGANLESLYGAIEKKALGLVADVATKEGISQIKSAARQLASVKTKVDDIGKKVVAELKELPKVIDANRKSFREKMEALQDEVRRPVTEIENREKEIDGIKAMHMAVAMSGSAIIRQQLEKVKAIELTEEKWKESLVKAEKAVAGEVSALNLMLQEAEKREEEARELEELRKKQEEADRIIREQKIKEEAERRAKAEAEARAAAEKARLEREKAEAERKAAEAEKARQEAQKRAERAEMERKAVESKNGNALDDCKAPHSTVSSPSPAPSKWTPEMKAVNKAVYEQIAAYVLPEIQKTIVGFTENGYRVAAEEAAKAVVKAILTGKIRNLKVEY